MALTTTRTSKRIVAKTVTLFLIHTFLVLASAYAQDAGGVQGVILLPSGEPAQGINVRLENTARGTASGKDGAFEIAKVSPGRYTLLISGVGYERLSIPIKVAAGEATVLSGILLTEAQHELEGITVTGFQGRSFIRHESEYVARMPLGNLENPQVYSVIPDALMKDQLVTDIQHAVQNAPGINNVQEGVGSGGVGLSVGLRGFSTDIALRNGMATNYVTLSDPVNLERLEVIKGPSATLFGSTLISYGGLVNRVTKRPMEQFSAEVGYSAGSFGLSRATADVNVPLNEDRTALFRITAAKHNAESFQDKGRERTWALYPNFLYKINDRLTVNLEAGLYNTARPSLYYGISPGVTATDINGLAYDVEHSLGSDELQSDANVFNVFGRATYRISDAWTSQTNYSLGNTDNVANYLFLTFMDNAQVRRLPMHITSNFHTNQIQQNFIGRFEVAGLQNRLLVGADVTHLKTEDRRTRFVYDVVRADSQGVDFNFDRYQNILGETDPFFQYVRNTLTYSAYVSDVINITDALNVMASMRVDRFSNEEESFEQTAWSPKFGIVYEVLEDRVSLFANLMDGFQNVSPDNTDPQNVVTFKPEHATQVEGGIKSNLFDGRLGVTASYYDITVRDIVRSIPDNDNIGGFTQVQDGTRKSAGFELELVANPINGWDLIAGYGYNDSEYTKAAPDVEGNRPYATPEHALNVWTSYTVPFGPLEGIGVGVGGRHVSESYLDDANTFTIPSYTVVDVSAFYDQPRYRLGLKLNNATDEVYWTSSYWAKPQATRNIVANLTVRF